MNLINRVRSVIESYYSGKTDNIFIPEDIIDMVFQIASAPADSIEFFCLYYEGVQNSPFYRCVNAMKHDSKKVSRTIVMKFIKELQQYAESTANSLEDRDANISYVVLSNLQLENMTKPFSFVMFDRKYVILLESDEDGGYCFSNDLTVLNTCVSWLSVQRTEAEDTRVFFLQEPLSQSADTMSNIALVLCSHDHMNMQSCYWYHSVWQYLRLFNMVSTPSWHHDFYTQELRLALEPVRNPHVMISGAADYSSLSYTMQAVKSLNREGDYTVLDLCETPLFACKWYGKKQGIDIQTIQCSIFDFCQPNSMDLICTDAFLTRFTTEDISQIVKIWFATLKNGGSVVTTVRIHDERHPCPETPSEHDIQYFRQKAYARSKIWLDTINCSPTEIANKAGVYAGQMKSHPIGSKEDIINLFLKCGFRIPHLEDVELDGELYPSRYLRIRAVKEG